MVNNQRDRILALLEASHEVSALDLSRISLQYSARIKELRSKGYKIGNRVEVNHGQKRGYFRLLACPESFQQTSVQPQVPAVMLFELPVSHRDEG